MILVRRTSVGEGWWEGELNSMRGLFPSSYVKLVSGGEGGEGRGGEGRGGEGREGKGREGKGREGMGWDGMGWDGWMDGCSNPHWEGSLGGGGSGGW